MQLYRKIEIYCRWHIKVSVSFRGERQERDEKDTSLFVRCQHLSKNALLDEPPVGERLAKETYGGGAYGVLNKQGLVQHVVLCQDGVDGGLQVSKGGSELAIVSVLARRGKSEGSQEGSLHLNEIHWHQQQRGQGVHVVLLAHGDLWRGGVLGQDPPELEGLDDPGVGGQLQDGRALALELSLHPELGLLDEGLEARVVEGVEVQQRHHDVVLSRVLAVHLEELHLVTESE